MDVLRPGIFLQEAYNPLIMMIVVVIIVTIIIATAKNALSVFCVPDTALSTFLMFSSYYNYLYYYLHFFR